MIAPPGWLCQPEEPPGSTVICAMATSVPTWSGMVPSDTLVPRAKGTFTSPDGGVASTDPAAYAATPTMPTTKSPFSFRCMTLQPPSALNKSASWFDVSIAVWSQRQHEAERDQRCGEHRSSPNTGIRPVETTVAHVDHDRGR